MTTRVAMAGSAAAERRNLQQAFAVFTQASEQLSGAYRDLQEEVARLTRELAAANGELQREYAEKQRMQDELRRNQRLSAMGEMAARLAHQLRTPLATALLYGAHLAQPSLQNEVRAQFSEKLMARLRHLEHLIGDMLLFVKGEAGVLEKLMVAELVAELRQVMEPQMARSGLRFSIGGDGGDTAVMADRKALSGALLSLLENAMQASPRGCKVTFACEVAGETLAFRVRDEGCGIPLDIQARLFEPFFTTRKEGTGLGLAIARGVAQSLGGVIEVKSAPGAGSEFVMRLPCAAPDGRGGDAGRIFSESELT